MLRIFRSAAATTVLIAAATLSAGAQTTTLPAPASGASPTPVPMPQNPPENPLVTARVGKEFAAWQHAKIDRSTYSRTAGGTYIDALVNVVSPDLNAIGTTQSITYRTLSLLLGDFVYRYDIIGTDGTISVLYALDQAGKTDSITFTPQIFRAAPATP